MQPVTSRRTNVNSARRGETGSGVICARRSALIADEFVRGNKAVLRANEYQCLSIGRQEGRSVVGRRTDSLGAARGRNLTRDATRFAWERPALIREPTL